MNNEKRSQAFDFQHMAERILLEAMDEKTKQGIYEMCKYQLMTYKGFIELGLKPQQAMRHTATHLEALFRANRDVPGEAQA